MQQVDELHLCQVEVLDLDVRNDLCLQVFELEALGIGNRPPLLLLPAEVFELRSNSAKRRPASASSLMAFWADL